MKAVWTVLFCALFALAGCAGAEAAPQASWVKAGALLQAAYPDLDKSGIRGLQSHVADFEEALAEADNPTADVDGDVVVLTDGMMDTLVAMAAGQKAFPGKKVVAVNDPYAEMAFLLGSYYNEIGRFTDALRVLQAEKARTTGTSGDHCASLTSERAIALMSLRRLDEALATYDEGLVLDNIDDLGKARMQRGRGYVLTEMNRLDEAEAAYNESLKLEPDNKLAKAELQYIMKLRMGATPTSGGIVAPPPSNPAPEKKD